MAEYDHLPIYKRTMDLAVFVERMVVNFSRSHRYTLGSELRSSLDVYYIPKQNLIDMAVESIKSNVREAAMTTYEQIKLEGKTEAAAAILARLVAKRFHVDPKPLMPVLMALSFEQHEELSEKILETESIEEILRWIETASHN